MASKIRLFERTQVGPTRADTVKPEFDLARGAGVSEIGAATVKFSGDIFNDLVATKAANEEATFQGQVSTAIQEFETFVAANPGEGYDRLEKERTKMFATLDKAGQTATTRKAQQNNKNFMLRNKKFINERTQTSMEAIQVKQELLTYESHRKNFMNNFDRAGLTELNEDMIESGLLNPEATAARQEQDFAIIDKAEKKVNEKAGINAFHAALEVASNPQTGTGDFTEVTELAKNPAIPEDRQTSLRSAIKTAENTFAASTKVNEQKAIEAELDKIDKIFILPQDEFLASVQTALADINSSEVLPVKGINGAGKEGQRKKINDRVNAIRAGKVDPITQFDATHYESLSRRIANNSSEVSTTEIGNSVGRGESRGLTGEQSEHLIKLKKLYDNADILGTDTHKIYMGALVGMRTAKAFSKNKAENSRLAARAQVALNRWAVKNPEAKEADYQSFMDNLVDNSNLTGWQRLRIHGNLNEDRFAIQENLDEIEAELGIGKPVKVISKDGVEGTVPADELDQALKEGFKRVE